MTKKNPTEDLCKLNEIESNNFKATQQEISDTMSAYDKLCTLTTTLGAIFQQAVAKTQDTNDSIAFTVLLNIFQLMRLDLQKGMLNLSKGYINDSSFHTRRIIESAAIIIEIVQRPHKVSIYTSLQDENEMANYVDGFRIFKLVKNNLSVESYGSYERLCLSVHPSNLATATRAGFAADGTHTVSFFDIEGVEDMPRLKQHILVFLHETFCAFRDIAKPLAGNSNFDLEKWTATCTDYQHHWNSHVSQLLASGTLPELNQYFQERKALEQDKAKESN